MKLLLSTLLCFCAAGLSAQNEKTLRENFENPPKKFRMNINYHHVPEDTSVWQAALDGMEAAGYGGFATNVSPGADYLLDDRKMGLMFDFVRRARARGMDVWLYDEKSYPSGMAGTLVLDAHPEWEAEGLLFRDTVVTGPDRIALPVLPGKPVLCAAVPEKEGRPAIGMRRELTGKIENGMLEWAVPEGRWHIAMIFRNVLYDGFQAGTDRGGEYLRYPSLLMPEVTRKFMEVTHERYASFLGAELGTLFTSTFTDEPSSMAQPYLNPGYGVYPWKQVVSDEFERRTGSPLKDKLLTLMLDEGPEGQRVRYTYFRIIADCMSRNFFRPIREFCEEQGMLSGGHLLVEETMMTHVPLYGSIMECFREMSAPGIDVLTGMPSFTRRYMYSSRLASSAAELEGNTYIMTEMCPITDYNFHDGKEAPTSDMKGTINRQMLCGVNKFNNYMQLQHEDDAGKERFNAYIGRVTSLLTGGTRAARIAVYYPIQTMWTKFRPLPDGLLSWDNVQGGDPAAQRLDSLFDGVSDCLLDHQWEFSYLDDRGIAESTVRNGRLVHGNLQWDAVILPGAETLSPETAVRLAQFVEAGGKLIVLETLPVNSTADFPSQEVQRLFTDIYGKERTNRTVFYDKHFDGERLNGTLEKLLDREVRFSSGEHLLFAHRKISEKDVYFLVNDSDRELTFTAEFPRFRLLESWNPQTGSIARIESSHTFTLAPYESMIVRGSGRKSGK